MKNIKKMLLGIASLLIAVISLILFTMEFKVLIILFIIALGFGIYLCIDGYLGID